MRSFLGTTRQAKDEWDAAWLAIKDAAVNGLTDIITKYVETQIIDRALSAATTTAIVAEQTAIAAAAAPAALAVNIATMGAAGAAAAGTFAVASSALGASMAALRIVAAERGALIDHEQLVLVGEGGKRELIAPEQDFKAFTQRELLPSVLSLIAREGLNVSGYNGRGSSSNSSPVSMKKVEQGLRDVHKAIKNLDLRAEIADDKLLWIVRNRERIEKIINIKG
jgi:hypothetical protein